MKGKKFDAVKMKRKLQKEAEQKLSGLSEKEQLELLRKKFGHLMKQSDLHRSKLSKLDIDDPTEVFLRKCGGWKDTRKPEEIIADIYSARRTSNRGEQIF